MVYFPMVRHLPDQNLHARGAFVSVPGFGRVTNEMNRAEAETQEDICGNNHVPG
jgi:hypothetical protein